MILKGDAFTCRSVIDQFPHLALHDCQGLPRLLLHQEPQQLQVGQREQVVDSVALMDTKVAKKVKHSLPVDLQACDCVSLVGGMQLKGFKCSR